MNGFVRSQLVLVILVLSTLGVYVQNKSESAKRSTYKVIVFYSTSCPICQKMTWTLNNLASQYKDSEILFQIVFPSPFDTKRDIAKFKKRYHIKMPCVQDQQNMLVNKYAATVTPECFLLDRDEHILYSGKIDNWFYDIAKYRQVITENYLQDAIAAILAHKEIKIIRTDPVGCFITK